MQKGCIFKRGASWVVQYREDVLVDGQVKRRSVLKRLCAIGPEYRTEADVRPLALAKLAEINAGTAKPETTDTLADFLEHVYLPAINAEPEIRPSTRRSYLTIWKLVQPYLNGCKLRDVGPIEIERILRAVAAKQLAHTTMMNARNFLSGAMRYAIRQEVYSKANPVREVKIPKGAAPTDEGTYAYTLAEVTAILAALLEPERTVCAVAAFAGLRKGEIMGLQWADYTGELLHVRRSFWQSNETAPKTKASAAPVPCIQPLRKILDTYRKTYATDSPWIFPCERMGGRKPLNLNNSLRRVIKPRLEAAGLQWHGWHAFRRGLATNLSDLGVPAAQIQAVMRHSEQHVTEQHYIKHSTAQAAAALAKLEQAMAKNARRK